MVGAINGGMDDGMDATKNRWGGLEDDDDAHAYEEAHPQAQAQRRASGRVSFSSDVRGGEGDGGGGGGGLRRRNTHQRRRSSMDANDVRALRRASAMLFGDDDMSEPNDERAMESRRNSRLNGALGSGGGDDESGAGGGRRAVRGGSIAETRIVHGAAMMSDEFLASERNGELHHLAPLVRSASELESGRRVEPGVFSGHDTVQLHHHGAVDDDDATLTVLIGGSSDTTQSNRGMFNAGTTAGAGTGCMQAIRVFWCDIRESILDTYRHLIAEYELNSNLMESDMAKEREANEHSVYDADEEYWGDDYSAFLAWGGATRQAQPQGGEGAHDDDNADKNNGRGGLDHNDDGDRNDRLTKNDSSTGKGCFSCGWMRRSRRMRGRILSRLRSFVSNPLVEPLLPRCHPRVPHFAPGTRRLHEARMGGPGEPGGSFRR